MCNPISDCLTCAYRGHLEDCKRIELALTKCETNANMARPAGANAGHWSRRGKRPQIRRNKQGEPLCSRPRCKSVRYMSQSGLYYHLCHQHKLEYQRAYTAEHPRGSRVKRA